MRKRLRKSGTGAHILHKGAVRGAGVAEGSTKLPPDPADVVLGQKERLINPSTGFFQ